MSVQPIQSLVAGKSAVVRGVVRRAGGELLTSSLGSKPCVYWDVRDGLDDAPTVREALDFWVDDGTGKVLVRGAHLAVDVLAQRQEEIVHAAEADHMAMSERLRELKKQQRTASGPEAKELARERARLAKIVTVLLAVRAHARGRVHVGGSRSAQERWIREHANRVNAAEGTRSIALVTERWEVVIEEGQEVEVEGLVQVEHVPTSLGGNAGYRDLPTCTVLTRSGSDRPVHVRGVGASAPVRPTESAGAKPRAPGSGRSKARARPFDRHVMITVSVVAAASALVWWLSR